MQKLVLIFGTFNPITNGHIRMGILAKERFPESRIIYVPAKSSFLKGWKGMEGRLVMDGWTRVRLMKKALTEYDFEVDDIEVATDISGRTYDTIAALKKKYDTDDICICMGTDKVAELSKWYKGRSLVAENKYLIISRNKEELDMSDETVREFSDNFVLIENDEYDNVSASMVREAFLAGQLDSIKESIPDAVYRYLKEHKGIYR